MRIISHTVAALERAAAERPWCFRLYAYPYRRLVARELALAGVSPADTVLNIGCGSLPFTAVLAAQLSGARVIAVDCDPQAVRNARAVVARLGLAGRIEVVRADAASDRLPEAEVALVALQAGPKPEIHRNLARSVRGKGGAGGGAGGTRAVFRLPRRRLEAEYGTLAGEVLSEVSDADDVVTDEAVRDEASTGPRRVGRARAGGSGGIVAVARHRMPTFDRSELRYIECSRSVA